MEAIHYTIFSGEGGDVPGWVDWVLYGFTGFLVIMTIFLIRLSIKNEKRDKE